MRSPDLYSVTLWGFVGKNIILRSKNVGKKVQFQHFPQQPNQSPASIPSELSKMPWMAANPSNPHPPLVIARPLAGPGLLLTR